MKIYKFVFIFFIGFSILMLTACGGGDSDGSTSTLKMSITDAKPLLPDGAINVFVTFSEVLVHKSGGGGWISLPVVQSPHTIDLLQFCDGVSTELVPPVLLDSGKYTQIRIVVSGAVIRFDRGGFTEDVTVKIPSGNLKTDKNFIIDAQESRSVNITIDFDLSRSIVVSGSSYKLKPVLHILETADAAIVSGSIDNTAFADLQNAVVKVSVYNPALEDYTLLEVEKDNTDPTGFSIFWLSPDKDYKVQVDLNPDDIDGFEFEEDVDALDLEPGEVFELNNGNPVS